MKKTLLNCLKLMMCLSAFIFSAEAKDYHYSVGLGYPQKYPMGYDEVEFFDSKGEPVHLYISGSDAGSGSWGWGSQASSLHEQQPLPASIKIRWFSIMENQFWEADYKFDQKIFEVLDQYSATSPFLYGERAPIPFMERTYLDIYVTPGGLVTIWITGAGARENYLLAQFHAKKTDMDWKKFISRLYGAYNLEDLDREKYVQKQKAEFAENNKISVNNISVADSKKWERYMKRYLWTFSISAPFELKDYEGRYTNGERYFVYAGTNQKELGRQAVPHNLNFSVVDPRTNKQKRIKIEFGPLTSKGIEDENWDEVLNGFEKIANMEPVDGPIDMQIAYKPEEQQLNVFLVKGEHRIELTEIKANLTDYYDDYSPVACVKDDPKLQLTKKDFSKNLKESESFVLQQGQCEKPTPHFPYRLLREDGKYYYGTTDQNGETVRIRTVVGGKRLNLVLYEDYRKSCVPQNEIPADLDIYKPSQWVTKKPFQIYKGARI